MRRMSSRLSRYVEETRNRELAKLRDENQKLREMLKRCQPYVKHDPYASELHRELAQLLGASDG
jgi:hypothetical protein